MKTAEQVYDKCRLEGLTYDITSNQNPNYGLPFYQAIFRVMESHTQAHTGGLRERVKELEALLNHVVYEYEQGEQSFKTILEIEEMLKS